MTTKTNQDNARRAYFDANKAADTYLNEIRDAIYARAETLKFDETGRPAPNWAEAGDAQHTAAQLKEIADQLLKRGEYAA